MNTPDSHCRSSAKDCTHTCMSVTVNSQQHFTPQNLSRQRYSASPSTSAGTGNGNVNIHSTPSPVFNPFDADPEHLKHPIVTPGIFQKTVESTPDLKNKPFKWDIEQQAILAPAEFGDLTERLERQHRVEQKISKLTQPYIEDFFNSNRIAPSPLHEPVQKVNLLTRIDEEKKQVRNASCQTDVHIPQSVDFNELLKQYVLSESQIDELNKGDSFSNSSLRRKLFVDNENDDSSSDSVSGAISPEIRPLTSENIWESPPLTELAASSPVQVGNYYSAQRRCSFTPRSLSNNSPNVSPISSPSLQQHTIHRTAADLRSSPDLQVHYNGTATTSMTSHRSQDQFQVSDRGIVTDSEHSYEGEDNYVNQQSLFKEGAVPQCKSDEAMPETNKGNEGSDEFARATPTLNEIESMCTIDDGNIQKAAANQVIQNQTAQSFYTHGGAYDTGYLSQMTNTFNNDTMSTQDMKPAQGNAASSNMSPPRSSVNGGADWLPPSSSTPNKSEQKAESSVWYQY